MQETKYCTEKVEYFSSFHSLGGLVHWIFKGSKVKTIGTGELVLNSKLFFNIKYTKGL